MNETDKQGWGWPGSAKKAHYFKAGESTSICGKWWYVGFRSDDMHDHPDNCAACMRKREKQANK